MKDLTYINITLALFSAFRIVASGILQEIYELFKISPLKF